MTTLTSPHLTVYGALAASLREQATTYAETSAGAYNFLMDCANEAQLKEDVALQCRAKQADWLVTDIRDDGPRNRYRFHVAGVNLVATRWMDRYFSRAVEHVNSARYTVHPLADDATRRAFDAARKVGGR